MGDGGERRNGKGKMPNRREMERKRFTFSFPLSYLSSIIIWVKRKEKRKEEGGRKGRNEKVRRDHTSSSFPLSPPFFSSLLPRIKKGEKRGKKRERKVRKEDRDGEKMVYFPLTSFPSFFPFSTFSPHG